MKQRNTRLSEVVTDITCDICGTSVVPDFQKQHLSNLNDFSEYAQLKAEFGYGSKRDGETITIEFCEGCFEKVLRKVQELKAFD